jgi:hypothetical protein
MLSDDQDRYLFKITYRNDKVPLRQWIDTFQDFKESRVEINQETQTLMIQSRCGSATSMKIFAIVVFLPKASRDFQSLSKTVSFWINNKHWQDSFRCKNPTTYHLVGTKDRLSISSDEQNKDSHIKSDEKEPKDSIPISDLSQQDGTTTFIISPETREMLLFSLAGCTIAKVPTKQLKNICLRLGCVQSLDDEHPGMQHLVVLDLTPERMLFSATANYRASGRIQVRAHTEEGKEMFLIHFAPGHPTQFVQRHYLYSLYSFCRNQHFISEYVVFAFMPGKALLLYAGNEKIAYKLFHLFPVSDH